MLWTPEGIVKGQRIIPHGGEAAADVLVVVQLLSDLAKSASGPLLGSSLHLALTILFTLITFPTPCQMCTGPVTEGSNLSRQIRLGCHAASGAARPADKLLSGVLQPLHTLLHTHRRHHTALAASACLCL